MLGMVEALKEEDVGCGLAHDFFGVGANPLNPSSFRSTSEQRWEYQQ